jgi:hypothetical protein
MGASLEVVCRSPRKAEQVGEFLEKHTPEPLEVFKWPYGSPWWVEKGRLGLKYSTTHGVPKEFVFAILRWVALNWGRRQRGFSINEVEKPFPVPVPYLRYDGFESWPVIGPEYKRKVPERLHWCQVDTFGVYVYPEEASHSMLSTLPNWMELMKKASVGTKGYEERIKKLAKPGLTKAMEPIRQAMRELVEKAEGVL